MVFLQVQRAMERIRLALPQASRGLPASLNRFLLVTTIATMVALVTNTAFHPADAPRCWRLYLRPRNVDYYAYEPRLPLRHTPAFFFAPGYPWYYPAPAVFVHYPFYQLGGYGHRVYVLSAVLLCLWLAWHLWRSLAEAGLQRSSANLFIGCLLLFAWPEYFALERGNIEALTWIPVAIGVWWYRRGPPGAGGAGRGGVVGWG